MRKSLIAVILFVLMLAALVLSFGHVVQGDNKEVAIVEIDKKRKDLFITPSGEDNIIILSEVMKTIGAKVSGFKVGDEERNESPTIYVKEDYGKVMRITFNSLWGKKIYIVKLVLIEYVKFYVDGELHQISTKIDIAANNDFPEGEYTWYTDADLTQPFNADNLDKIFSLYASTT